MNTNKSSLWWSFIAAQYTTNHALVDKYKIRTHLHCQHLNIGFTKYFIFWILSNAKLHETHFKLILAPFWLIWYIGCCTYFMMRNQFSNGMFSLPYDSYRSRDPANSWPLIQNALIWCFLHIDVKDDQSDRYHAVLLRTRNNSLSIWTVYSIISSSAG